MLSAHFPDGLCLWSTLVEYHSNYGNRPRRIFTPLLSSPPDGCTSEPPSLVRRTHTIRGALLASPGPLPRAQPPQVPACLLPPTISRVQPFLPPPTHTHVDNPGGQPGAGLSQEVLGRTHVAPACRGTGAPEGSRRGTPHPPPHGPRVRELFPHRALPSSLLACDKPVSQPLVRRA